MFRKILVAVDGSGPSEHGLDQAIRLAKSQRARLFIVHVLEGMPAAWSQYVAGECRPARVEALFQGLCLGGEKILAESARLVARRGRDSEAVLVHAKGRSVARAILDEARDLDAELIVLGTHGRSGLSRLVLGSNAEEVLHHANVPVLLVRCPDSMAATAESRHADEQLQSEAAHVQ